ncbi:MAG: hypothetical protein HY720_02045 [Planctomycetes bacterium]|nr:hypothetical protein [Planctomycetota bacterium]
MKIFPRCHAAALIVVVAVLSVMLVMALSFARLMAIERSTATIHSLEVQARMAAEAGVEQAIGGLRMAAAKRSYDRPDDPWIYRGEDFDGDGTKSARFEDSFPNGEFETLTCPVESALRPSFPLLDPATGLPVLEWDLALSGRLDTEDERRSVFALKVLDAASQLDVNGGLEDPDYARRVAAMIDRVWEDSRREATRVPEVNDLGRWLIDRRPAAGYSGERELKRTLALLRSGNPGVGLEVYRRLSPYIVCHPWRDSTVVAPRRDRIRPDPLASLLRYEKVELALRAPVNLNTASRSVLYAVLADISGWAFQEGVLFHLNPFSGLPELDRPTPGGASEPDRYERVEIGRDLALSVAEEIVAYRQAAGPFRSWNDFDLFVASLVEKTVLSRRQADLVRAQAHPDTDMNKFDPDQVLYKAVDKSDLLEFGPEFCLSSMGRFEIESYGRVHGSDGSLLASAKIVAEVVIYDVLRDTTIADFEAGSRDAVEIYPEWERALVKTYDGQLGLAGVRSTPRREPALHATFDAADDDWPGRMEDRGPDEKTRLPFAGPLVGPGELGTVFRGGAYSEEGLYPRFNAQAGYLSDANGAIAFWYKPNWNIVSAAPRPHAVVDLNGKKPDSTFQIYNDTLPPSGSSKGLSRHYLKFLAWDIGNNRTAEIKVRLEEVTEPREWLHVALAWDGQEIRMWVRGEGNAWGQVDTSRYTWSGLAVPLIIEQVGGRWRFVPQNMRDKGQEAWFWRTQWSIDGYWTNHLPTEPIIPWPNNDPTFESKEDLVAFLDYLLTLDYPNSTTYPIYDTSADKSASVHFVNDQDGSRSAIYRAGDSGIIGFSGYFSGGQPIRFGFESDPTSALRFGGQLKVVRKESPDPDRPPHYDVVSAPSNGIYGDLITYNGIQPGDATIAGDLKDLFRQGRYYKTGDAWFESREFDIPPGARLGSIDWDIYQPAEMPGVRVLIAGRSFTVPGEGGVGAPAPEGPLKYRIEFLPAASEDEPLLETPYVDSVTVTVLSTPRFVSWQVDAEPTPIVWKE